MSDSIPRFNHVALTVAPGELDGPGRAALLGFYGEVFGWSEMPGMSRDRELFVLRCHSNEQFVYVHAADEPMRCGATEHVGMSVPRPEDLDEVYRKAQAYQARDSAVELSARELDDYQAVKLHHFYVRYRLPVSIEVQCFEWAEGLGAQSLPG